MPLFTLEDIQNKTSIFNGRFGHHLGDIVMKWLNMDKINDLYDRYSTLEGPDFASAILKDIGITYKIIHQERLDTLPQGPFIVISNHPYGSLDGVMLVDIFGHMRSDFKLMVNGFLSRIRTLDNNFITVTPTGNIRSAPTKESMKGIREAMEHVRDGGPIGIFPSGAVSDLSLRERCIRDREWQEPVIRLIQRMRAPILPLRFLDGNSPFYYSLGLIDWRIRLLRLPSEVFNKRGDSTRIMIGKMIPVSLQDEITDIKEFSNYLRDSVYKIK